MMQEPTNISGSDSQNAINQLVLEYLRDQKSRRRWRWVWRGLWMAVLGLIAVQTFKAAGGESASDKPHVGIIDITGPIMDGAPANADNLAKGLVNAYKNPSLKALILRINSPGGSPVQADYMFNTIRYYRTKYPSIKTYAVCVDLCASAAYYAAVAADEIYASPASMVGSIGVVYNGFGFVDLLQKVGVTRRLQTAGRNKGFLDPFSPEVPAQQMMLQTMLNDVHQQFIARVKEGRGSRLHINNDTFSGLIWTGEQARVQGLIDGFASSGQLARKLVKSGVAVDYTATENVFDRFAKNMGTSFAGSLPGALGIRPGFQ
ncbi:S49 family peptidase [Legionella geestiana]|uniref:S49 family peptidase n=1 Tax=Legionella geestiana TaxID=45065 RepID=UPI0010924ADF|nr:S49 family peptidase [Legionella geestiana]QDQ39183.1 S49 family peptidase [Legionella geestiana]